VANPSPLSTIDHVVLSVYDEVDSGAAVVVRPSEMISDPQAWADSVDRLAARGLVDHGRPGGKFLTDAGRAALGHLS
jgi:Mn-dependent DtxR family transcriptional regulator